MSVGDGDGGGPERKQVIDMCEKKNEGCCFCCCCCGGGSVKEI